MTWLPIPGFDGYEVSDSGQVRSVDRVVVDVTGRAHRYTGRLLALQPSQRGYMRVGLRIKGHQTLHQVHRLVLLAFVGPPPSGTIACHGKGGPSDNRPENLRWDTHGSNNLDAVRDGTHAWAKRTHCTHGHEYTEANTYVWRGKRLCRACLAARRRDQRARLGRSDRPNSRRKGGMPITLAEAVRQCNDAASAARKGQK